MDMAEEKCLWCFDYALSFNSVANGSGWPS